MQRYALTVLVRVSYVICLQLNRGNFHFQRFETKLY